MNATRDGWMRVCFGDSHLGTASYVILASNSDGAVVLELYVVPHGRSALVEIDSNTVGVFSGVEEPPDFGGVQNTSRGCC